MTDQLLRGALTLGGAYFFGVGGALVGGLIGDILFPPKGVSGPRLNELNFQRSTVGAPIPIYYGTYVGAGNVIWSGGLIETKHTEEQGGKFGIGGTKVSNYTYAVDVAIGIAEGTISGIRRVWADADLIYDSSDDATLEARLDLDGVGSIGDAINAIRAMSAQLDFELYLGTEDQMPDPTIESYEGVGVTPAYRGLAYIVFPNFQLANYGNRIPNFRFEVVTSGTPTECGIYSAGRLYPWQYQIDGSVHDPRNPDNYHIYKQSVGSLNSPTDPFAEAMADMNATLSAVPGDPTYVCGEVPQVGDSNYIRGWAASSTPNYSQPCDSDSPSAPDLSVDRVVVSLNLNTIRDNPNSCDTVGGSHCLDLWAALGEQKWAAKWFSGGDSSGFHVMTDDNVYPTDGGVSTANWDPRGDCTVPGVGVVNMWAAFDQEMSCRRWHEPSPCLNGIPLSGAPGYCTVNGVIVGGVTWTRVAGTFKSLRPYIDSSGVVTSYPVDPTLASSDPNYNNQAFWEAAYAAALADPTIYPPLPGDWVYGVDYPQARFSHATNFTANSPVWYSECDTLDVACVPMGVIVADICRRAGLRTDTSSQIDVSDLTTCVIGYAIGSQMSARDALGPLRQFGLWDAVESGEVLRFVERGHAIVENLTANDLGAHEYDSQPPSAIETSRLQEKDLPRRVRLHFPNYLHDHEASEQAASRLNTEAVNELDINLAIAMEPDTAAQLAEILLYAEFVGRNTYRLALDNDYLGLEPTDCIEVPVDGQTERVRIVAVNFKIGGILELECQRDDDGSYVSTKVAQPSEPSGGVPGTGGSALICPSATVLLDIPRLRDIDIDAGYYAAIYSTCGDEGWTCAELYRSNDDGLTYARVARTDLQATVGEITDLTGPATDPTLPGDSPPYDTANTITVSLFNGELETITDTQIDAGQNLAAVGIDGRWVLIQFKTATFDTGDTWVLSDLIWGVNDTQHLLGTTGVGDTFVLLSDAALLRIPENPDAIGVAKSFKAVTCGEALDAVTAFDFTTWGLSYQRLCPSSVISATTLGPPTSSADGDSYLLPNDTSLTGVWATHGGEIATWSDETDSWVYCTPAAGTIIHIDGDTSTEPGDDVIAPGGGGTPTAAPWTPAIPPLLEDAGPDPDASYFVIYTPDGYRKILMADAGTGTGTGGGSGTGGGGDCLIAEATVTGSAATTLTVSGLDLAADEHYLIRCSLDNATAFSPVLSMFFNGDTTTTNYDRDVESGGAGATNANNANFASQMANAATIVEGTLTLDLEGNARLTSRSNYGNTTLLSSQQTALRWRTVSNVTSITISSSAAGSLAVGSNIQIYSLCGGGTGDTGGGGGFPNATYVTEQDETADLPNSLTLSQALDLL